MTTSGSALRPKFGEGGVLYTRTSFGQTLPSATLRSPDYPSSPISSNSESWAVDVSSSQPRQLPHKTPEAMVRLGGCFQQGHRIVSQELNNSRLLLTLDLLAAAPGVGGGRGCAAAAGSSGDGPRLCRGHCAGSWAHASALPWGLGSPTGRPRPPQLCLGGGGPPGPVGSPGFGRETSRPRGGGGGRGSGGGASNAAPAALGPPPHCDSAQPAPALSRSPPPAPSCCSGGRIQGVLSQPWWQGWEQEREQQQQHHHHHHHQQQQQCRPADSSPVFSSSGLAGSSSSDPPQAVEIVCNVS